MLTSRVVFISDDNTCSCLSKMFFLCLFEDDFKTDKFLLWNIVCMKAFFWFLIYMLLKSWKFPLISINIFWRLWHTDCWHPRLLGYTVLHSSWPVCAILFSQENSVVGCQFSACVACLQGAFLRICPRGCRSLLLLASTTLITLISCGDLLHFCCWS